jgi:phosphoesterase RecJ-like protein
MLSSKGQEELQKKCDEIKAIVRDGKTFAIVGHQNPDGDCIGACVTVAEILTIAGKDVSLFNDGDIDEKFSYMPKVKEFNAKPMQEHYDVLFVIDLGDVNRLGSLKFLVDRADKIIVIDHHIKPTIQSDVLISLTNYASTGEILFNCIELAKVPLTTEIATAIYTSISCDTGCFLFANTSSYTHYIAQKVMEFPIDIELINFKNFREYDRDYIPAIIYVIKNMTSAFGGRLAISVLPYSKVKKWQLTHEARHGFFKYTTDGKGIIASIFLTELKRGEFNVSLRSIGNIDVSIIARALNGGGHKNASGTTMTGTKNKIIKQLLEEFKKVMP